jgi:L-asparaginase
MGSRIALLTTGGTVSTVRDAVSERTATTLGAAEVAALAALPEVTIDAREWARVPSWTLDPRAMARLALAARDLARDPALDGVVVTHGTTTLEYSAFVTAMVVDTATPVVFTGAMRRADDPDPDGPRNLRDAVRVASSPAARGFGCLVVFAGRIIPGWRAWKSQRAAGDAFASLSGDLGRVGDGRVELPPAPPLPAAFSGRLDPNVAFVKAVPGADRRLVEAALAGPSSGLVLEGLPGAGAIPPAMQPAVLAAARALPVVVASRAPFGELPEQPTGGTGEPLSGADLLSAGPLTAEQAWLLLMLVLGEGGTLDEVKARFRGAIRDRSWWQTARRTDET